MYSILCSKGLKLNIIANLYNYGTVYYNTPSTKASYTLCDDNWPYKFKQPTNNKLTLQICACNTKTH